MSMIDLTNSNLAINGGPKVRKKKWFDNITTGQQEKEAAIRAINSGYLSLFEGSHTPDPPFSFSGGPEIIALEEEWSQFYGSKFSIALNSATSGLYAAIGALEIGFGDEVIVSPYTMSACALAPLIYGAIPVFADIDPNSGCLDPESISQKISMRTKAILIVHQFGFVANMDAIMDIAKKYNLKVIEDCAQAHGAKYKGKNVGTIGDIGVFSLNVNKTIQAGEGGICITNDLELSYRIKLIRNHGEAVVEKAGYKNILNIAGFNYRMTEISAAIAREQLKKLPYLNKERLSLVNHLKNLLKSYDFLEPMSGSDSNNGTQNVYYIFPVKYNKNAAGHKRNIFTEALNAEGMLFYQGYVCPLYLQPIYQKKLLFKHGYPFSAPPNKDCAQEYKQGTCPVAERLHFEEVLINEHIRLPHKISDIESIDDALKKLCCS